MSDYNDYDGHRSAVLEGMYKGVAGKIDEVRENMSKEIQYNSAQQASAYEALADGIRQGMESVLTELRYLSEQSSAIHDVTQNDLSGLRDALLEAVRTNQEELERRLDERVAALRQEVLDAVAALPPRVPSDLDERFLALRQEVLDAIAALQTRAPSAEEEQAAAEEAYAETSPEPVAAEPEEPAAEETVAEEIAPASASAAESFEEQFDYDVLAEKIVSLLPETDYDLIVDKLAAAVPGADADFIADRVVSALPPMDETSIADKVAEVIPVLDYDLAAEHVSAVLEHDFDLAVDEEGADAIAERVAAHIDYEKLAARVAELVAERAPAPAAVPVAYPAPAAEASEPAEEPRRVKPSRPVKPAVILVPPEDSNLTTRYKRSFTAKIIESEADIKEYYSELKNALLSYAKVTSQINWTNDRFSLGRETVAKIGVRGKTLCLYVALNPEEFPESVYHQKFAGDTKMYEKTPMMVKIKSGVALKRALRLVELVMEHFGAVYEEREPVDYTAQYAFRSEEALLKEGLIKTALVEKSDLDF